MAEQSKKPSAKKGPIQGKKKISDESSEADIFQAPTITREPASRQAKLGSNVVLRISAEGRPLPSYQWFHNGKKISGANTERLTISKTRRANAGAYHCEVKNFVGKAASRQCMLSFFTQRVPKLVLEPKSAKVEEGKPIHLKLVTNNPAELEDFKIFWVFNGMRIKGAIGPELKISAGKKKYEGEYKAMISVGSGIESSNVAKVTVVPAKSAPAAASAPAPAAPAAGVEHEGTMVAKLPDLSLSVSEPEPAEEAPAATDDWNDFLFNPDDEEGEGSAPEPASQVDHAGVEDSTRDFDSRSLRMNAQEADELLGVEKLNPVQAIEKLKANMAAAEEEKEKSRKIVPLVSEEPSLLSVAEHTPAKMVQAPPPNHWEAFTPEEDPDELAFQEAEEQPQLDPLAVVERHKTGKTELSEAERAELAGLREETSLPEPEPLSETQKSLKIRELMEQMDGEEAQLAEALRLAVARAPKPAEEKEPSALVEVVGSDGFTGAIDLLKAVEAKDAGDSAEAQLFDPDPLPAAAEAPAPVKQISEAPRRARPAPQLAKKREFLESMLARWQSNMGRKQKDAA